MALTPEQTNAVTRWVAEGDSLSTVQKKLLEQFQVSMTYMDVRFLVDDLNLQLKDTAPKADASDVTKAKPAVPGKKGFFDKAKEKLGLADGDDLEDAGGAAAPGDIDDAGFPGEGVRVDVDAVTLIPGALASGTVTFSDGVTGKWIVDNYGRPGFTEISQPGYRPSPEDAQAFMQELNVALQQKGL